MFFNNFLKSFRILLFPFSLAYWLVVFIRNKLYDRNIFKSTSFGLPVICIGNLSVGGTGKSPMAELLVRILQNEYKVTTLSRGYKRKTRGFLLANKNSTALDIGDEPMQFFTKFPGINVAVGEDRVAAMPQLLQDRPDTQVVILDDAFQHRAIKAGLNILLTDYNNLFTRDFCIPSGDLRDLRRSYKRADIIVVTKCPILMPDEERKEVVNEIKPLDHQSVFFACNKYGLAAGLTNKSETTELTPDMEVLLITGIANPAPLKQLLEEKVSAYEMIQFPDHYIFTIDDWEDIKKKFFKIKSGKKIVLTTEKDEMRLLKFGGHLKELPVYSIPIRHQFLFNEEDEFRQHIVKFVKDF